MSRMNAIASSLCLILVGVGPVAADEGSAPKSLQMRSRPQSTAHSVPKRSGKHVAQAAPDQPSPDGSSPDKTGNPSGATPGIDPPASSPEATTGVHAAPTGEQASELSEAEFEKLAEQTTQEEVIVVTGSTIG